MTHPLTKFREDAGLSRAALAKSVKTSRQSIHRIENGEQTPSLALVSRLLAVAAAKGVELKAEAFVPEARQ